MTHTADTARAAATTYSPAIVMDGGAFDGMYGTAHGRAPVTGLGEDRLYVNFGDGRIPVLSRFVKAL